MHIGGMNMTALETLIYNSLDLATLGSELYCTTTCLDGVSDEGKSTTIACSVTTALNHIQVPDNIMIVRDAQSYVESMSTEELVRLEQLLDEKELTFTIDDAARIEEPAKVYTKQSSKQQ